MKRTIPFIAALALVGLSGWYGGSPMRGADVLLHASVALAQSSCNCPENQCANGKVAGCSVTCPAGQNAECACDGYCDDSGNPGGFNRCACQE